MTKIYKTIAVPCLNMTAKTGQSETQREPNIQEFEMKFLRRSIVNIRRDIWRELGIKSVKETIRWYGNRWKRYFERMEEGGRISRYGNNRARCATCLGRLRGRTKPKIELTIWRKRKNMTKRMRRSKRSRKRRRQKRRRIWCEIMSKLAV